MSKKLCAFLCLFMCSWAINAKEVLLRAYVDKVLIQAGESLVLTIEYLDKTDEEPKLNELEQKFSILSRQAGERSSLSNGNYSYQRTWTLELLPKSSSKSLTIPAIRLGSHVTDPIEITQGGKAKTSSTKGVDLKVFVDKEQVYINSQLIITIEIKTSLSLRNGSLSNLKIKDAIIKPLVQDEQSDVVENGIKYKVFKRSFAVFPNNVGMLLIPPIVFEGVIISSDGWPFFSGGERVSARSPELLVKVLDVPEKFPKDQPFVAAKNLVVIESIEGGAKFLVNQATSRRFEIKAQGALTTSLPQVKEPEVENLQVYTETSPKEQTVTEAGIEAHQKLSHTYMPQVPGPMKIPEQVIYWWDTEKDELKTTVIRELLTEVAGDASKKPQTLAPKSENEPELLVPTKASSKSYGPWLVLAAIFLLILAVLYWWLKKQQKERLANPRPIDVFNRLIKAIRSACVQGDAKGCYRHLESLRAFQQSQGWPVSDELLENTRALEASLYQKGEKGSTAEVLGQIKKMVLGKVNKGQKVSLPPIYPK